MKLTGRNKEIAVLQFALASEKPELVAVVGRRRVGKTFLVRSVYAGEIVFEVTGLQKGSKKDQLQNFVLAVKYAGLAEEPERPDNWLDAFFELTRLVDQQQYGKKAVLFFDELPWLDTRRSGFLQGFSFFWNSWASQRNVVVVICGSAASWMIKKVINDRGGLHNRVTRLIQLKPFNLREMRLFLHAKGLQYPHYQLLQLYMVFGGIPMYLEMIQPGLSPIENINRLCFEPQGYLRNEFQNLYAALFENHEAHTLIVRALAGKRKGLTREELLRITKLPNGGTFSTVLEELTQSGFIGRYSAYGKKKKELAYRLEDQYSLFYLAFVEEALHNPTADFGQIALSQAFLSWSGYCFENICLAHLPQIKQALGISGVRTNIHTFYTKPDEELPGAQIDLLIERADKCVHLCEIKFSESPYVLKKSEADKLRMRETVFRHHTGYRFHLFTTLITTFGIVENSHSQALIDQSVDMEALFREVN